MLQKLPMDQLNLKIIVAILSLFHFHYSFQASLDSLPKMSDVVKMMQNIQHTFDSFTKRLETNPHNNQELNFQPPNETENPPFPEADVEFPENQYDKKEVDDMPHSVENPNSPYPESEAQTRLNEIMENAESMMENFEYLINLLQKDPKLEEKSIESALRQNS